MANERNEATSGSAAFGSRPIEAGRAKGDRLEGAPEAKSDINLVQLGKHESTGGAGAGAKNQHDLKPDAQSGQELSYGDVLGLYGKLESTAVMAAAKFDQKQAAKSGGFELASTSEPLESLPDVSLESGLKMSDGADRDTRASLTRLASVVGERNGGIVEHLWKAHDRLSETTSA